MICRDGVIFKENLEERVQSSKFSLEDQTCFRDNEQDFERDFPSKKDRA